MDFDAFVEQATGFEPYPYQRRIAAEGLPELLRIPTGAGKSVAAVLPWLWRRLHHPDERVRAATPRRLVVALPLRTLVDQFADGVAVWLSRLGLAGQIGHHVLLGGRRDDEWRTQPERESIVIGSIDMLLSRALNRGYAASRYRWPMEFGLLNTDSQWVFDEVQLLGAALPTTRQLQAFRERLGTWRPTHSTWMSATVDPAWMPTVDAPQVPVPVELGDVPTGSHLERVVGATRRIEALLPGETSTPQARLVAERVVEEHSPGTRTLVFVNTVDRARKLAAAIRKAAPQEADVVLVHSRFRPEDRARITQQVTTEAVPEAGQIIVSTQALEAGVDISSTTLITETCAWSSLVQRAGRCNRRGEAEGVARLLWVTTKHAAPYEDEQVVRTQELLEQHEGQAMTGAQLADLAVEPPPTAAVLRRRDLEALFDTLPDLTGDDVDVSPYVRDADDRDVFVAWRHLKGSPAADDRPAAAELVRVPIGEFRGWVSKRANADTWWQHDHLDRSWRPGRAASLRPGQIVLIDANEGGYTAADGWHPTSRKPVEPVLDAGPITEPAGLDGRDQAVEDDPLSHIGGPVELAVHLRDTEGRARELLEALGIDELPVDDICAAARLHDLGKVHTVCQAVLRDGGTADNVVLAKSRRGSGPRYERRGFRHEAASLAALRGAEGEDVIERVGGRDHTLVRYLVAAHHGKVRIGVRPLPSRNGGRTDWTQDGVETALGLAHGERLPAVDLGDGVMLPETTLDIESLTAFAGPETWLAEVLELLGRDDIGPFRLAFLEALVILADWRASAAPSALVPEVVPA